MTNIVVVYEPFCAESQIIQLRDPSLSIKVQSDLATIAEQAVIYVKELKGDRIFFKSALPVIEEFTELVKKYDIDKSIEVEEVRR